MDKDESKIIPVKPQYITINGVGVLQRNIFADNRGFLVETFADSKEKDPSVYSYSSLVQPGCAKDVDKFHHHQKQQDRFTVVLGKLWILLYDMRKDSSTFGKLEIVEMEGGDPKITEKVTLPAYTLTIPQGVYHGIKNPGEIPTILVNHPTFEYNPEDEGRTLFSEIPIVSLENQCFSWDLVKR